MIPVEVRQFLSVTGNNLLIKGEPGVGKTIFALEILKQFYHERDIIYLSTRSDYEDIVRSYPSFRRYIKPENIISANNPVLKSTERPLKAFSYLDLSNVPRSIQLAINLASTFENPIIIFDSWNPLMDQVKEDEVLRVENQVSSALSEYANAVFVTEGEDSLRLEYMVDGVLTLKRLEFNRRLIRELEIEKLRGVAIERHRYLFTLKDAEFTYFRPYTYDPPFKNRVRMPFREDPDPNHLSTMVDGLDGITDGWLKGSINLFEIDVGVGIDYFSVLIPFILSNLNFGRLFVSIPTGGLSGRYILESHFRGFVPSPETKVKFIESGLHPSKTESYILWVDVKDIYDFIREYRRVCEEMRKMSIDKSLLLLIGLDTVERWFRVNGTMKFIAWLSTYVRNRGDVAFMVLKRGQSLPLSVIHTSTTYWKIGRLNGSLIFYGIVPDTGLYAIETTFEKGYPHSRVTQIM